MVMVACASWLCEEAWLFSGNSLGHESECMIQAENQIEHCNNLCLAFGAEENFSARVKVWGPGEFAVTEVTDGIRRPDIQ